MKLLIHYNEFINYQLSAGNSPATVDYYKYCLVPFVDFFNDRELNKDNFMKYAIKLRNKNINSVSVRSYSKGIKSFLSWLYNENHTIINLSNLYLLPKQEKKEINILNDYEIIKLFNYFNLNTHLGLRNYCIIGLMYDCGLRKSEVINLKLLDIDTIHGTLLINGKGNKQRIVPIGKQLLNKINHYLKIYGCSTTHCIFSTNQNKPITQSAINRLFKTLKTKLNINRLHPHLLRHTFATHYLINGGNINSLQKILGHSDIETVQIYLHIVNNQIINQFSQFSPLDTLIN